MATRIRILMSLTSVFRTCGALAIALACLTAGASGTAMAQQRTNGVSGAEQSGSQTYGLYPCAVIVTRDSDNRESLKSACTTELCKKQCTALRRQAAQRNQLRSGAGPGSPNPPPVVPGASTVPKPALAQPNAQPNAPATISSCDAGGCWGSDAQRYSGPNGAATLMNSQGRLCTRNGPFIQCF